jgi:hypothetical protein
MISKAKGAVWVVFAMACFSLAAWFGAHSGKRDVSDASRPMRLDAPPGVRFVTVALGGFRGLLADILWVRASDLQDRGSFFEVAQLADWITRLEPRYPEVWIYHAWNMAYNITAVVPDPSDRWHWVMNGIRLLRDEGIPSNPGDPKLYWELGWLYFDKVGGRWDEARLFYRISWAREMSDRMGGGLLNHAVLAEHRESARTFREIGLNPEVMKAMDEAYGPLDWRLPETHAMYWGFKGRPYQKPDARWCDRLVWMGLTESIKGGHLVFLPERKIYQQGPRLDLAIKGVRRLSEEKQSADSLTGLVANRFLRESTVYLYAFGRKADAEVALQELRRFSGGADGRASLDDFVKQEVGQVEALSLVSKRDRVVGFLARADIWRRLKVPEYGEGFEQLAHLYWDALVKTDHQTPDSDWETITRLAHERSLREMP